MTPETVKVYWRPWNPVTGCSLRPCTAGCRGNCWARAVADRFPQVTAGHGFEPTFHVDRLGDPIRWQPERWKDVPLRLDGRPVVAVGYQGDLFDPAIPFECIAAVYGVESAQPGVAFLHLTKDVEQRRAFHERGEPMSVPTMWHWCRREAARRVDGIGYSPDDPRGPWPLPNVWEGTSIMTQEDADERLGADLDWLSVEPLLERVDLHLPRWPRVRLCIVGPETGSRRRPCDPAWIADVVAQCEAVGIRVLVKGKSA